MTTRNPDDDRYVFTRGPDGSLKIDDTAPPPLDRASFDATYVAVLEALRRALSCSDGTGNVDGRDGHWVGIVTNDLPSDLYLETHGSPQTDSCAGHEPLTDQQVAGLVALGWQPDPQAFGGHFTRNLNPSAPEDAAAFVARTFDEVLTPGGGSAIGWEVWCGSGDTEKWSSISPDAPSG